MLTPYALRRLLAASCGVALLLVPTAAFSESATGSLVVRAEFGAKTSLAVSATTLQFVPDPDGRGATAHVDVRAAARTQRGGDVLLLVQPLWTESGVEDGRVRFDGQGDGMQSGVLLAGQRALAGRWIGSGVRSGSIDFRIAEFGAQPSEPLGVQFLLTAP